MQFKSKLFSPKKWFFIFELPNLEDVFLSINRADSDTVSFLFLKYLEKYLYLKVQITVKLEEQLCLEHFVSIHNILKSRAQAKLN